MKGGGWQVRRDKKGECVSFHLMKSRMSCLAARARRYWKPRAIGTYSSLAALCLMVHSSG